MNENNAAQAEKQAYLAVKAVLELNGVYFGSTTIKAIVGAVLSKLRAPVADERAAFEAWATAIAEKYDVTRNGDHYMEPYTEWVWEAWQASRAALASAPIPKPWPVEEQPDGAITPVDPVDMASAPVAGEAHRPLGHVAVLHSPCGARYFSRITSQHQAQVCAARWAKEYANVKPGPWPTEAVAVYAAPQASAEAFDFVAHLVRQAEFSARTFGPGARVAGVCDHIRKELIEVETSGGDLKEWVDVIILGLDGAWRSGATPQEIIAAIVAKQAKNEARTWPDWRAVDPNKAIEHQRTAAPCTCPSGDGSLRHPCPMHPGADKVGDQQRAEDAERWRWATATDENAQMLYTIVQAYGGDQKKINERADFYRAALSSPQAEQGDAREA
ncbi:hypothetical protein LMG26841_05153 [Achromobacter dolens]|uniref:dATP/dGTP diphosphohydrolase MazZ domain-containing protein n=1 Tax=Achromobacter dolens TaxID=1287738 RepID=A0A6S7EIQ0_9BURK|nr:dATP/dGTP pyrophosphohydrolase domain-containing protein [Achromobacter dolens]CAB3914103.1 hypothetical protein LMG26841_05153 [Achromobacter dolens]